MPDQLELFKEYKEKLKSIAGEKRASEIVSQSLYVVCAGSDDVANTYFITPFRKTRYDIPSYANLLLNSASSFIEVNFYNHYSRKTLSYQKNSF